jgi:hypothetical protein
LKSANIYKAVRRATCATARADHVTLLANVHGSSATSHMSVVALVLVVNRIPVTQFIVDAMKSTHEYAVNFVNM